MIHQQERLALDNLAKFVKQMNKDLEERRKLFDAIQPMYIDLILLGIGPDCSDEVFLRACGIKNI